MERIKRACDEVRVFASRAERTGVTVELQGTHPRKCSSLRDRVRKYKLYGDGLFYLPAGHWPPSETAITLDNVKWMGVDQSFRR